MDIMQLALHNPLFSGGAALGVVGGTIAMLRRLPSHIWDGFLHLFTISVEIPDTDPSFNWIQIWIDNQPASKKIRNIVVNTDLALSHTNSSNETLEDRRKQILLAPALGKHILRFDNKIMWLHRQRVEVKGGQQGGGKLKTEFWNIRVFGRNQEVIKNLISDARELYRDIYHRPRIVISSRDYWETLGDLPSRDLDSVILPTGIVNELVNDIEQFLYAKSWYTARNIPYRRGYMFQGPPGTGKSSLVIALAQYFNKPVYILNLASMGLDDDGLTSLLRNVPSGAIVLFEDIDATTRNRDIVKQEENISKFVSLSGLLNALDGLVAKEGRILIMTTNHPEKLDTALIRPGRVDKIIQFDYLTIDQAKEFYSKFFESTKLSQEFGNIIGNHNITPAVCQEHLLRYRDSAEEAVLNAKDLIK